MIPMPPLLLRPLPRLVAVAMATALTACATGPDFTRPDAPGTTRYKGDAPLSPSSADAAESEAQPEDAQQVRLGEAVASEWWTMFRSPALDGLIRQAVAKNPNLTAAEHTLAQAREAVAAQQGTRWPQVDMTAGVGRQKYGKEFLGPLQAPPAFTYYAFGPTIRYTLETDGGPARSVEAREAEAEVQRQQYRAAYLTLAGNIALQAIAMASAREQLRTIEGLVADDRRNVSLVQTSFDAGYATRVDLLSAQSQLTADAALLPSARLALENARHALAILAGEFPGDAQVPEFTLADFTLPAELPVTLPSDMARLRPDILAAEATLHAATAEVGVATADLYPHITLSASGGPQALTFASLFDRGNLVWALTSGLVGPLFDGGTRRARQRGSIDAMKASASRYQSTLLDAMRQVADALSSIDHDGELVASQRRSLDVAQQSLDLARQSYQAGNAGILQVLDAERLVQRARLEELRARVARYDDTVELYMSLGGVAPDLGTAPPVARADWSLPNLDDANRTMRPTPGRSVGRMGSTTTAITSSIGETPAIVEPRPSAIASPRSVSRRVSVPITRQ